MSLDLYRKFLYREVFCSYRKNENNEVKCAHPYSFGECDLELGPIVQEEFANIIFKPEGIKLVIKEPREDRIGGVWKEEDLDLKIEGENNRGEIIEKIKEKTKNITKKNRAALIQRINDIFQRYEFLFETDNRPGLFGGKREEAAPEEEEELFEEEEEFFAKEQEELFEEEELEEEELFAKEQEEEELEEEELFAKEQEELFEEKEEVSREGEPKEIPEETEEDLFEEEKEEEEDKGEGTVKKNGNGIQESEGGKEN